MTILQMNPGKVKKILCDLRLAEFGICWIRGRQADFWVFGEMAFSCPCGCPLFTVNMEKGSYCFDNHRLI